MHIIPQWLLQISNVQGPVADNRHSCDKGAVLEGFPHRRAGEAGSDSAGREPHCTRACRKGREASVGGDKF